MSAVKPPTRSLTNVRVRWLLAFAAICAGAVAVHFLVDRTTPATSGRIVLLPDNEAIVAQGKLVYLDHCASCHGQNLEGQPNWRTPLENGRLPAPPHDVTGHTWHHPDSLLFDIVKRGSAAVVGGSYESDMPGYDDILTDEEIVASLSFIKSQWPEDVRRRHDQINLNAE